MLAPLVALALAASPGPRALPNAPLVLHVPNLEQAGATVGWFQAAGRRSALLSPANWSEDLHPLLTLTPGRLADFTEAGLSTKGPFTMSARGDDRLTCSGLANRKRFEGRVRARLNAIGEFTAREQSGASVAFAKIGPRAAAGYAIKGDVVCAFSSLSPGEAMLEQAIRAATRPEASAATKKAAGLPGKVQLVSERGVAAAEATGGALRTTALTSLELPGLAPAESPFAKMKPSGLAFVRGRMDEASRASWVRRAFEQWLTWCSSCDSDARKLGPLLEKHLTGNFVLRIDAVKVKGTLSSMLSRYASVRHAVVFELDDGAELKAALRAMGAERSKQMKQTADGFELTLEGTTAVAGVKGNLLSLSNDEGSLAKLDAIPLAKGKLAHGLEYELDPAGVARALSQVSIMDVLSSKDLAAIFAAGTELQPLLRVTRSFGGWVDSEPGDTHRAFTEWVLEPAAMTGGAP